MSGWAHEPLARKWARGSGSGSEVARATVAKRQVDATKINILEGERRYERVSFQWSLRNWGPGTEDVLPWWAFIGWQRASKRVEERGIRGNGAWESCLDERGNVWTTGPPRTKEMKAPFDSTQICPFLWTLYRATDLGFNDSSMLGWF